MAGISKEERQQLIRAIKTADENFKKGMYALAEPTYRRGVSVLGDGSAEICDCIRNLALICKERKDFNEALTLDIRLLLLNEERFGEDHANTIALMDEIAGLYEQLGRNDESRDMYERARKASERSIWADQQNEPEHIEGTAPPVEIAKGPDLDYQYSETAKTALESSAPEVLLEETPPASDLKSKRAASEETMKLPKRTESMTSPQPKDPQLETLILDRVDSLPPTPVKKSNGAGLNSIADVSASKKSISKNQSDVISDTSFEANNSAPVKIEVLPLTPAKTAPEANSAPTEPAQPQIVREENSEDGKAEWKTLSTNKKSKEQVSSKLSGPSTVEEQTGLARVEQPGASLSDKKTNLPSKNQAEKKVTEVKLFQSPRQRNIIIGILAGSFALMLLASLFASHGNPQEDFKVNQHRYRTADGEKLFYLATPSECEFVAGAEIAKMKYFQFHGDIHDTFAIIYGPLLHHQQWLMKGKDGVKDEKGSILYAESGPELEVADAVEQLGRSAQLSYLKLHHYPRKLEELDVTKRGFHNPFTNQTDKPIIQVANFGSKKQADDGGVRKKLYAIASSGAFWTHEQKRHPGEISCYSAVIHTKKGDINTFYIRGFDREGKPISGHNADTAYTVVLDNGVTKPSPHAHLPFANQQTMRPRVLWLLSEENIPLLIWLRFGAAISFTLLAFAAGIASANTNSDKLNATMKGVMLLSVLLALIYILGDIIP